MTLRQADMVEGMKWEKGVRGKGWREEDEGEQKDMGEREQRQLSKGR